MPSFPYTTSGGVVRNRSVFGAGTVADPDVAVVSDIDTKASVDNLSAKLPSTLGVKSVANSLSTVVAPPIYSGFVSMGVSAGGNIKNSSGSLFGIVATNAASSIRFIQIFNKSSAPINGDIPVLSYPVYANFGNLMIDINLWGNAGVGFSTGISWGFSSTLTTYTAATGADVVFEARYV